MFQDLQMFAVSDPAIRKSQLCSLLQFYEIPYIMNHSDTGQVLYILISSSAKNPKLIIGAHFDSVPGSTGANDNAAAVIILIHLLHENKNFLALPVHFVFFNGEESGHTGARAYITHYSDSIGRADYINLDMCGVGDTIVISTGHMGEMLLPRLFDATYKSSRHRIHLQESLPDGDDIIFTEAGRPNSSICTIPFDDIEPLNQFMKLPPWRRKMPPYILQTIHNMPHDTIHSIQIPAMEHMLLFLYDLLREFSITYD